MPQNIFSARTGRFEPQYIPTTGDLVKLDAPIKRESESIVVTETWQVHKEILPFDTLCFARRQTLIVFQVQPSDKPGYGKLVEIYRSRLEQDPRHAGARAANSYPRSE